MYTHITGNHRKRSVLHHYLILHSPDFTLCFMSGNPWRMLHITGNPLHWWSWDNPIESFADVTKAALEPPPIKPPLGALFVIMKAKSNLVEKKNANCIFTQAFLFLTYAYIHLADSLCAVFCFLYRRKKMKKKKTQKMLCFIDWFDGFSSFPFCQFC